ncbi:hypothetical protein CsatB_020206 [Cannabis sativa]
MIVQEECQRSLGNSDSITLAVASSSTNPPRTKKPRPSCSNCGKPGHLVDKCYFLHGFPPGYGDKRKQDKGKAKANVATANNQKNDIDSSSGHIDLSSQCQQLISLLSQQLSNTTNAEPPAIAPAASNLAGTKSNSTSWIVDSGATHHMCCNFRCFSSFSNIPFPKFVSLPNGQSLPVHNIGTVKINSKITLQNVLFDPTLNVVIGTAEKCGKLFLFH